MTALVTEADLGETKELKGLAQTTHVCGKCQVVVPCNFKIPSANTIKQTGE